MSRVVLPGVVTGTEGVDPIAPVHIPIVVVVVYEVVVSVDIDIVVSPAAAITPAAAPGNTHRYAGTVSDISCSVISVWRVIHVGVRVCHRSPNERRVVIRNVDHFRTGLFNHYDGFAFDLLRFYFDLFIGLQLPPVLRFGAHTLDGVHHVTLLGQKGVSQFGGPLDVLGQLLDNLGQRRHRLNARIPVLVLHGLNDRLFIHKRAFARDKLLQLN